MSTLRLGGAAVCGKKILQSQALVANSAWQSGVAATTAAVTPAAVAVRGVLMQAAASAQCAGKNDQGTHCKM